MRGIHLISVVAAVAVAGAAAAEDDPEVTRVAVLDVQATGNVEPKSIEGLSSLVAVEVARQPGVKAVTPADIQAVLGFEAEKQLLGCADDTSCLAEIGGALGVQYLLTTEISQVGSSLLLVMTLLDTGKAEAVHREARRPKSEDALIDEAAAAVEACLARVARPGATVVAGGVTSEKPGGPGWGWPRWAALGGGVVALGVGTALYLPAQGAASRARNDDFADLEAGEVKRLQVTGNLGLGLAVTGLAAGVAAVVWPAKKDEPVTVSFVPTADGVWAGVRVEL